VQNHFAQMCYHVCVLSSFVDLEDSLEFLTKCQEKHHVAFTKFSILTSFSILCQNDESKLLYGVEFWCQICKLEMTIAYFDTQFF
jgi:hypothetical protein